MRVLLVRHAVTSETGGVLTGRLPGVGLSAEGRAMAEAAAERLSPLRVRTVYSSPIQRCRETADIVAAALDRSVAVIDEFSEVDYGSWSGRRLSALRKLKAWRDLFTAASRFRFPDGETLAEAQFRAVGAVEDLVGRHRSDDSIVVVSHADIIRVLLAHHLGMPLDLIHRLHVGPASVSVVDLSRSGPARVPVINHLEPERWT